MFTEQIKADKLHEIIDLAATLINSRVNVDLKLHNTMMRISIEREMFHLCLDEDFEQWKFDEIINHLKNKHEHIQSCISV